MQAFDAGGHSPGRDSLNLLNHTELGAGGKKCLVREAIRPLRVLVFGESILILGHFALRLEAGRGLGGCGLG